ncbi:DUF4062 domain-containing protein [Paraburkholderia sediminicola]|uniref:DUF4062 domain-containing protein n=1 Tax=Paraburkholderia sediminicola TaxID=458836 RepID=UPI0038B6D435
MSKRYQVFLSSTYADLKDERQKVIQTLMEMDCIPAGMELFPAADEEQLDFIKKVIDDCDYYLLVIGGRYGSVTQEGISYTEKEYDYALTKGIKVIALLHGEPDEIPQGKTDKDPALAEKLAQFRSKVSTGRLVKFWKSATELPGLVALSLSKTIKTYPAVGWVRADSVASSQTLSEMVELQAENKRLREALELAKPAPAVPDIADFDDVFTLFGTYKSTSGGYSRDWTVSLTWREIFSLLAPSLLVNPNDGSVQLELKKIGLNAAKIGARFSSEIDDQVFNTVKIQLISYGLVLVRYLKNTAGGMGLFWSLTPRGNSVMIETRTVRKVQ